MWRSGPKGHAECKQGGLLGQSNQTYYQKRVEYKDNPASVLGWVRMVGEEDLKCIS